MRSRQRKEYEALWELHEKTIKVMEEVSSNIRTLNDTHQSGVEAIRDNTVQLKEMVAVNQLFIRFILVMMMILIIAVIILAGGEKIIKVLPFIFK
ncbi:MAG: hypothetical protein KatS3mg090_1023 [Patescibacteria group bacterium]|nr:MAG: hypothetical protein KatS3mg090_1023 [Patescibacteria group bacterium]